MQLNKLVLGLLVLGIIGMAGCSNPGPKKTGEATVGMTASTFEPARIEVTSGKAVTWENDSGINHDVTDAQGQKLKDFAAGDKYTRTFTDVGEWKYYCSIHSGGVGKGGMEGTVVVTA